MKIEIMNMRNIVPTEKYDFICDRTSPLGNPYHLYSEKYRAHVCEMYQKWFDKQLLDPYSCIHNTLDMFKETLAKQGKLRLFCWCVPKQCHVETIKRWLEKEMNLEK